MTKKKEQWNDVTYFQTFLDCLYVMKTTYVDRPALTFYREDGERIMKTYRELTSDIEAFAVSCTERGFLNQHIAIISENRYEWVVAFWALVCCNNTVVPIDIEQTEEEMLEMAVHADARVILLSDLFAEKKFAGRGIGERIRMGRDPKNDLSFDKMLRKGHEKLAEEPDRVVFRKLPEDSEAVIIYTSGSTSLAKPAILTQKNIMYNACHALALVEVGKNVFTPLPFYHAYALVCGMTACLSQGVHFSANGFLKTMMRDLKSFEPETLISVPLIQDSLLKAIITEETKEGTRQQILTNMKKYQKLKKWHLPVKSQRNPLVSQILGHSLKRIISGGAHLNENTAIELEYYGIQVLQGYGITECSPLISVNRNHANRLKSVGQVMPGVELKFLSGEILVKGPTVFKGYYKAEDLTQESLRNGWFYTGDIGYMDKEGFLYICGRKKTLIVFSNGKKVVPEELEQRLVALPHIKEVIVYGANNGRGADEVKLSAMIYPDMEKLSNVSAFEILEKIQEEVNTLNQQLPFYKRIQAIKVTEAEFGKTGLRKIKRSGAVL